MIKHLLCAVVAMAAALCTPAYGAASVAPTDANIVGHVVDSTDGEHLPFCLITLQGTHLTAMTDASGHYALRDLTPGSYTVTASYTGYSPQSKTVTVEKGKTVEVNFELASDAFMLDQVVVTSSKTATLRRESPALVSVTAGSLLTDLGACSLADGLDFQPGVRVENDCQNCGFTQVRINGLDGHYSQILMNSRPVFSALTGVYGLEQIPANMIDRIEVMRGGGSALFGSSAIGGTINIITKDPQVNSAQFSHTLSSIGISGSLDNNTTLNASLVSDNHLAGIMIYGQSRTRDGYDHNADGYTEIAALQSKTIGSRMFLRPTRTSRLSLEYHATHEYRRGGDNLELPPHQAMVAEETDHNIHAAETTYDLWMNDATSHLSLFAALQSTRRKSYYGSEQDPDAYGRTTDLVVTTGAQFDRSVSHLLFSPAELVAGIEYNFNKLHDVTVGYNHDELQRINIFGAYLQNEWRTRRWGFLIGARLDKHSLISNPIISPRANIRFNPSDKLNFRLSYSTGFRSPQAYDEDFHVAVVGGERVVTVLAPGLRQESSQSVSASADMYFNIGSVRTNFLVEGFFTDLDDVFALRQLDEPDAAGNAVLERYNGSGARVMGLNLEAKAMFSARFDLQAGITLQRSRYKEPERWSDNPDVSPERRMFRTPDLYGYITANAELIHGLRAVLSGTLTGPMTVQHLVGSGTAVDMAVRTPSFFDFGVRLSYTFKLVDRVSLAVNAGITNILNAYQRDFDTGYQRDSGYIYGPALPRSLSCGVTVSL